MIAATVLAQSSTSPYLPVRLCGSKQSLFGAHDGGRGAYDIEFRPTVILVSGRMSKGGLQAVHLKQSGLGAPANRWHHERQQPRAGAARPPSRGDAECELRYWVARPRD